MKSPLRKLAAIFGAAALAAGIVAGAQANPSYKSKTNLMTQHTPARNFMGYDIVRPFNRVCSVHDWRTGHAVPMAEFLPSEMDRHEKISPNGPYKVDVHPWGMKQYMDRTNTEQAAKKFRATAGRWAHMRAVADEFEKAKDAFAAADKRGGIKPCYDFLDELAGAGRFQEICTKENMTVAIFRNPLVGDRSVRYADITKFLKESYGKPEYAKARGEFEKARESFWHVVTQNHMRGRNVPACHMP